MKEGRKRRNVLLTGGKFKVREVKRETEINQKIRIFCNFLIDLNEKEKLGINLEELRCDPYSANALANFGRIDSIDFDQHENLVKETKGKSIKKILELAKRKQFTAFLDKDKLENWLIFETMVLIDSNKNYYHCLDYRFCYIEEENWWKKIWKKIEIVCLVSPGYSHLSKESFPKEFAEKYL